MVMSNGLAFAEPRASACSEFSGLLDDHDAVPGAGRRRAIEENPKFVHDTGKAQEIPRHGRRLIGTRRCVRATEEVAGEDMLGAVHADDPGADEPGRTSRLIPLMLREMGFRGIGRSSALARAAAIEVISEPESTRNVSGLQTPLSSRIKMSSSARSTRSPVAQTYLLRSGISRRDMVQGCPILMVRTSSWLIP
jgi:hypothetical protein